MSEGVELFALCSRPVCTVLKVWPLLARSVLATSPGSVADYLHAREIGALCQQRPAGPHAFPACAARLVLHPCATGIFLCDGCAGLLCRCYNGGGRLGPANPGHARGGALAAAPC